MSIEISHVVPLRARLKMTKFCRSAGCVLRASLLSLLKRIGRWLAPWRLLLPTVASISGSGWSGRATPIEVRATASMTRAGAHARRQGGRCLVWDGAKLQCFVWLVGFGFGFGFASAVAWFGSGGAPAQRPLATRPPPSCSSRPAGLAWLQRRLSLSCSFSLGPALIPPPPFLSFLYFTTLRTALHYHRTERRPSVCNSSFEFRADKSVTCSALFCAEDGAEQR